MDYTFSLPTFLVVIIIVILFRTLDKRNRSLEKVKRFSDKLKEEISVFIKEKTVEINDIAVDLDLNLKKSREVLKRILTFEEALKAKEGDFKNMKATVDNYAGTLNELVAMSGRVDENLSRIKDESVFIDRVGSQVKDVSHRITKLETSLENALTKSTEKNRLELDKIRKKLLDTHRDSIEELEQNLHIIEQNVTGVAGYVKKLEERRSEVVKTAEKAYRELLSGLDEEIIKRRKQGISELSSETGAVISGAQEEQEKITLELRTMLETVHDTSQALDAEYAAKIEDFKEQYTRIEKMFHEQLEKAAVRGETFNDEVFHNLQESIDKKAREQAYEIEEYFKRVNTDLDTKKKEIGEMFGVLRSDANVWHVELDKQMKDLKRQISAKLRDLENEVSAGMTDFLNRARDTQESVSLEMEDFTKNVEQRLETYDEELAYKFQRLKDCNVDIEELEKSLRAYMAGVSDKIKSDFSDFGNRLEEERSAETAKADRELSRIRNEIEGIDSEVKALKTTAYENVSEKLQILEDDFFADFKERSLAVQTSLDKFQEEVLTRIEQIKQENNTTIESMAADTLEEKEHELREFIDSKIDVTRTEINENIESMVQAFEHRKTEIARSIQKYEEDFHQTRLAREQAAAEMDEYTKGVEERLGTYEEEISFKFKKLEDCNVDIESMEKSLRDYMDGITEKIRHDFSDFNKLLADERSAEKSRAAAELENYREEIENIEAEINTLKTRAYENVSGKLSVLEDDFFNDFRERSDALRKVIEEFQEEVSTKIETIKQENIRSIESAAGRAMQEKEAELREAIDTKLDSTQAEINGYIASMFKALEDGKIDVQQNIKQLEENFKNSREKLSAYFSGTTEEARQWHEEILQKYQDSEQDISEKLSGLTEDSSARINTLKQDVDERRQELEETFNSALNSLQHSFVERQTELETLFSTTFTTLEKNFAEQKNDLIDATTKERAHLKDELDRLVEKASGLGQGLSEIEKQQKNFVAQTKIFERADTLKINLESDIDSMKKELVKISAYKKDVDAINKEFVTTRKLVDDMSAKVREFVTEKKRINSMETDFKRLISISHEIDAKIVNITTNYDAVQELELKMRTLEDLEKEVDTRFARLEQKKKVLDSTTQGVDKNFQKLTGLDKSLGEMQKEMKGIPSLIKELKAEIELISANKEKTDAVVDKMEGIDHLILELEARMDKLNIAREWLARAETRLEQVNTQAQEQLRLLESLIKEEVAQTKKDRGAPSSDKRQTVVKLAHQGWSVQEIARATKLSRGEVELILELIPEK